MKKLFIEAVNIGSGGGITHIREFLRYASPQEFGFDEVEIWGSKKLLSQIPDKEWLKKKTHPLLNGGFLKKMIWQWFFLPKELKKDLYFLYLPAGNNVRYHPKVSFCQNLQPFDPKTQKEYGWSLTRLRLMILGITQAKCFQSSDGVIYLTDYSMKESFKYSGDLSQKSVVIPHAVEIEKFFKGDFSQKENPKPFKILYVSTIVFYKRQDVLLEAVGMLSQKGFEVELTLVGGVFSDSMKKLLDLKSKYGLTDRQVKFVTKTEHDELPQFYKEADLFVMASSCETFGITLLEAMATGIPVLCADNPSLKETLADGGEYYETFSPKDLSMKIEMLMNDRRKREEIAKKGFERAKDYHWERTANETFSFFQKVNSSFLK
ncbi:MAG: glycosyltransferase family 1 protein [Cytophagales bacterium]